MRYNAHGKTKSVMKRSVNTLLEHIATPTTRAVVIDAETLLSSQALVRGGACPENVRVINSSKDIIQMARKKGHKHSIYGISTKVLSCHHGPFDIVYLDYCGTPDPTYNGFLPETDFWWMSANLSWSGIGVVTFSKRTTTPEEKARLLAKQANLTVTYEKEYFETCAMYMMVLTKLPNKPLRCLFDSIYNTMSLTPKRVQVPKPKTVKPRALHPLYKKGDRVGVLYHMNSKNGKVKLFKATVSQVRKRRSTVQYFLMWDSKDRSIWVNQDIINKKLKGRQSSVSQTKHVVQARLRKKRMSGVDKQGNVFLL